MKSLAELKRLLVVGAGVTMVRHYNPRQNPLLHVRRRVKHAQTNGVQFEPLSEGQQGSWLMWPKAAQLKFYEGNPELFSVHEPGGHEVMAYQLDKQGDFRVVNHGSVMIVHLLTESAREWVAANVQDAQFIGNGLVVEPRYIHTLVNGMEDAGLDRV